MNRNNPRTENYRTVVHCTRRACSGEVRRGNVVVLAAVLMIVLTMLVAFSIDIGYLCVVRTELQRTADSSALAGAGALYTPFDSVEIFEYSPPLEIELARKEARTYGVSNGAGRFMENRSGESLHLDLNDANIADGDIVLGRLAEHQFIVTDENPNAVQVAIRMTDDHENGSVDLILCRVFGLNSAASAATATASVANFPVLMPITTSETHYDSDSGPDEFSFSDGDVLSEPDGIPEIVVYPGNWNGVDLPPGNFGAVQIGPELGTKTLRSQIDSGPTSSDFDHHGGSLYEGMELTGKTGLSADIQTAFVGGRADGRAYGGVIGQTRFMPLYSSVTGNGHNATFTIVRFVAVRIMDAVLKSGSKRIVVQPIDDEKELVPTIRLRR